MFIVTKCFGGEFLFAFLTIGLKQAVSKFEGSDSIYPTGVRL
jgi:hypothetical protein